MLRTEFIYYRARNDSTGRTIEIADAQKNGGDITGLNGLTFTEVDNVNQPGIYRINLTDAILIAVNVTALKGDVIELYIDDQSAPSTPTIFKFIATEKTLDDLSDEIAIVDSNVDTILIDTSDMQPRIVNIESDVNDNKVNIESSSFGLSALKVLIDTVQTTLDNLQNVTRFSASVPATSIVPGSGNTDNRVFMFLTDQDGNLEDPDSNQIQVSAFDNTGADVTAAFLIFGSQIDNGGGKIDAVRDSLGQYRYDYRVANTAPLGELSFKFEYVEGGKTIVSSRSTVLIDDVQSSGLALETTAQAILTDTSDMQPRVGDIQNKINDASIGLANIKALIDTVDGVVDAILADVQSGVFGLAVINSKSADIQGAGFVTSSDSLKQISDRVFSGGNAI